MELYPINLDIAGKSCAVIGGGAVALRKIRGLLAAGARVTVIAPEICQQVEELATRGEIFLRREKFSGDMLTDEVILIAATDSAEVNQLAAKIAHEKKILVNVAAGEGGNFNVPSKILRGDLLLTISTGANSPAFARFLRQMLEAELGENFAAGLEFIARKRQELKKILPDHEARKIFWRQILTRRTWQLLKTGELETLEATINHALESFGAEPQDGTD